MTPPTLHSPRPAILIPQSLFQDSFHPYGTAITTPLPPTLNNAPTDIFALPDQPVAPVFANQGSAVKYTPIAPMQNTYGSGKSRRAGSPRMSMFSCFPRTLRTGSDCKGGSGSGVFDVRILERHPYTSQTFIPLSCSSEDSAGDVESPIFLVIVAPTLTSQTVEAFIEPEDGSDQHKTVLVHDPPDLNNLKAFVARPGQAVTYAAGTWHAPMAVLGKQRIDFLVVQFTNGIDEEDCQEVMFGEGVVVEVDKPAGGQGAWRGRAKL